MAPKLDPETALIFRITHIDNVPWILENGLHCRNSGTYDEGFRTIGNPELIDKSRHVQVPIPPGGVLSEYIRFYFTPYSPMMLNIKTGHNGLTQFPNEEIVIVVSSLFQLRKLAVLFAFTDRHAHLRNARFSSNLDDLGMIDWKILKTRDFKRDPDLDPGKVERYQAEALVHHHLPLKGLIGIACHNESAKTRLENQCSARDIELNIVVRQDWYFK